MKGNKTWEIHGYLLPDGTTFKAESEGYGYAPNAIMRARELLECNKEVIDLCEQYLGIGRQEGDISYKQLEFDFMNED